MVVSVAVGTRSHRSGRELGINLQLHRIAKSAADSYTRGDNLHLQEENDQLVGLGRHFVTHQLGHPDNRELIQAFVADQVIEICGQNGVTGRELTIRDMYSEPGRITAWYGFIPQDLQNGITNVHTLVDFFQCSNR